MTFGVGLRGYPDINKTCKTKSLFMREFIDQPTSW
jgi:hypothetical protein